MVSGQSEVAAPVVGFSLDKVAHYGVFGVLAISVVRIEFFRTRGWRGAWSAAMLAMLFGGLDEFRQSFTPGRSVEISDWVADTLGAITAVAIYQIPRIQNFLERSWRGSA